MGDVDVLEDGPEEADRFTGDGDGGGGDLLGLPGGEPVENLVEPVDFDWPDRRVVVEIDGFAFHSSRSAFERDREGGATLAARRIRVLRCTWRQLTAGRDRVLVRLAQALGPGSPWRLEVRALLHALGPMEIDTLEPEKM